MKENSDYDDILTCFIYNFNQAKIITRTFDINKNLEIKRYFKPYNSIIPNITNSNKQKGFIFLINNEIYMMNFTDGNLLSKPENIVINHYKKIRLLYNKNKQTHEFLFISSSFDKLLLVFNNNFNLITKKLFNSKTSKCIYSSFISYYTKDNEHTINKRNQLDSSKFFQKNINNKFKKHRSILNNINDNNNKSDFNSNNGFNNLDKRSNNDIRNRDNNNDPPLSPPGMDGDRNRDRNNTPHDRDPPEFNMTEREINNNRFDLGECEQILKTQYNLDDNISLIINRTNNNGRLRRGPMSIEVYEPINNTKLNLSLCNNARYRADISVNIDERNLFKYDKNSSYYYDIYFTYTSENGTDVILNDRRKEFIRNNMSLCERNCNYKGYDRDSKNAKCDCEIIVENTNSDSVSESENDDDENFFNSFINIASISNIEVINCYKNIFTKDRLIKNCGSYIILTITLIYIISLLYFIIKGYNNFMDKINIVVKNSHIDTISNNNKLIKVEGKIKNKNNLSSNLQHSKTSNHIVR